MLGSEPFGSSTPLLWLASTSCGESITAKTDARIAPLKSRERERAWYNRATVLELCRKRYTRAMQLLGVRNGRMGANSTYTLSIE